MDTSETYIKMRFAAIPDLGLGVPCELDSPYIDNRTFMDKKGDWYAVLKGSSGICTICQLERQDQFQEMLTDTFPDGVWKPFDVFKNFWYWFAQWDNWGEEPDLYFDVPVAATSMEQLWLAFLMKEKHNKILDGEVWQTLGR